MADRIFMVLCKSLIQAVRFSLSKMEMLESGGYTLKFTGLDNFKYALFQDPTYNQILATSIRDIVIDVPLIIFSVCLSR